MTHIAESRSPGASPTRARGAAGAALLAVVCGCATPPQPGELAPEEIETTVFLIGDAGEPDPRAVETPLDSLLSQAATAPGRPIIVFLGDNVYPDGVPRSERAERADARRRLAAQVRAVPEGAQGIFIPGNHDWAYGGPAGLYSIRRQEELIDELAGDREVRLLPENGCPGPAVIDTGRLRLVLLDTQWWLHDYIVHDDASDCTRSPGEVTDSLRTVVAGIREGGVAVVAGHHPLMTGGEHGGYCGVTGPFHRFGGRGQDIISSANRTLRDSLESAFSARPPLVYAAGHDHNLQVLRGTDAVRTLLVSGAGSPAKASCAVHLRESYYVAQNRAGFMRLDILRGRGVLLSVFRYERDGTGGRSFSRWIEKRDGGT